MSEDKKPEEQFDLDEPAAPAQAAAPTSAPTQVAQASPTPAPANPQDTADFSPADTRPGTQQPAMTLTAPAPMTPEQEAIARNQRNLDFHDDLSTQKIAPQTYHQLYDNKDTLGKVGTLFGLLVSGAGSGLTGQPNAVMHMMDQEIQRDYNAQVADQSNKQNWFKLAMEHERMLPENQMMEAQARNAQNEADYSAWRNAQSGIIKSGASVDGLNNATLGAVQSLQNNVNRMPPGPARDAAQANLDNIVKPGALAEIGKRNADFAQKKSVANALNPVPVAKPNPPPAKGPADPNKEYDAVDQKKLNAQIQKGKFAPQAADALDPATANAARNEQVALETNRKNAARAVQTFEALQKMPRAGQTPVGGLVASIGTGIGTALGSLGGAPGMAAGAGLGNFLSRGAGEGIQSFFERNRDTQVKALTKIVGDQALAESMLPKWADAQDPNSAGSKAAHESLVSYFKNRPEESAPVLTEHGLKHNFPNYEFKAPKQEKTKESPSSTNEAPGPSTTADSFLKSLVPGAFSK